MEVTEVRISPAKGGKVRAFASVVFDDCFIVNDLRVIEGREGQVFVSMPARKTRNGQMRDIAHPLDSKTRELIEQRVIEEFETAVQNRVVPKRGASSKGGKDGKGAALDRLAARLFNEEYWISDAPSQSDVSE
jgi:stage V sporulation protein G